MKLGHGLPYYVDYDRYDEYEDLCAYVNSYRATSATGIRVLVASGVSDDENPPTSMRMLSHRSLVSYNKRVFSGTIKIPTAQDTNGIQFDEMKFNNHLYGKGLSIGYTEVEDDKEPVWAAVSKHSSSYDAFFDKTDTLILRDFRQCTLLFPFSAIGFTATIGSISLLKSFITDTFIAVLGIRFPHDGSSFVSVKAFRMAMKRVKEEVESQMNHRENHDIANGAFQDDDLETEEPKAFMMGLLMYQAELEAKQIMAGDRQLMHKILAKKEEEIRVCLELIINDDLEPTRQAELEARVEQMIEDRR